jgi:uncharacterized repeat protein (TIGR01451 family)
MNRGLALLGAVGGAAWLVVLMAGSIRHVAAGRQALPLDVVINEAGWSGTACGHYDEWMELYNNTSAPVDLAGWTLQAVDGTPNLLLAGTIPAHGYYLLERQDDDTISDIPADLIYTGALEDVGETLELRDGAAALIDAVNADGGGWPGGTNSPDYSMERIDPAAPGDDVNWATNDGLTRNGLDCNGVPINGTAKARNSATPPPGADLSVRKGGPQSVLAGEYLTYTITLSNAGQLAAVATWLTDALPAQVEFVTHTAPYPFQQAGPATLVWDLGIVPTGTATAPIRFAIVGQVSPAAFGEITNVVTVTSATTESNVADNHDAVVTVVGSGPVTPVVLIEALYYDAYQYLQVDEAFRLANVSSATAHLGDWGVSDQEATALFPPGTTLAPGQAIWCAQQATAFARQFGFRPDFEYGSDSDPSVPDMDGGTPMFNDEGDECLLVDAGGEVVDALVYEDGETQVEGWQGMAVEPWSPNATSFPASGQILYRKRDQATGLPVSDTNTAADWAQDPGDHYDGRKVLYPGWDLDRFFFTQQVTETAVLTVAVAPDHSFSVVNALLASATESIQIESYSFRSRELADVLLERLGAGVSVTLLLEGDPAFVGVTDQEKWIAGQLHAEDAKVLFMVNNLDSEVHDRYPYLHAKLVVVDGRKVLIGSENLNHTGLPADDKADGTAGRRGVLLLTDGPGVVASAQAVLDADADPANHLDIVGCAEAPALCTPPPGFVPKVTPAWTTYTVQFAEPLVTQGHLAFEVIQSPENSLRSGDGLLGLLSRAGQGDTVLVEQSYEHCHWGAADGTPATDPNPRLAAYLDAARRGASVRILLDQYFDVEGKNEETVAYLLDVARAEGLDLEARLADPTSLGLHNKMVLAQIGGHGFVHVGSINGGEASCKVNRELALQVQSDTAYDYLSAVFDYDWSTATPPVYLPSVVRGYQPSLPADHLLISEVYYATFPENEWIEIYNPSSQAVDLAAYKIGDAAHPGDYEGMYRFPAGTSILPNQALVVAVTANGFEGYPGQQPDFEIWDSDSAVPDLISYPEWGEGDWGLANLGDEVLLMDGGDQALDVVVYGDGAYPGVLPHPGGIDHSHSLERYPSWLDTDDCSSDFRDWPYPSPGTLP